jgi:hypothetical protein
MNDLSKLKARLLADRETYVAYEEQAPEFAIARELIDARIRAGMPKQQAAVL